MPGAVPHSSAAADLQLCRKDTKCGGEMRIIAFLTEASAVREILAYVGEPTSPPRISPARGPPLWEMSDAEQEQFDPQAQPAPDYEFDQRIAW